MTNFYDRVILRLNNSAPEISPLDIVKNIWWFQDGKWEPQGFSDHGDSYLTLTEQNDDPPSSPNVNLFEILSEGTSEPLLVTDRGLVVQKDIAAGGYISANQGELWVGSGRDDQVDVPKIILTNASISRLQGGGIYNVPAVPSDTQFPTGEYGKVAILTVAWNGNLANTLYKYNGTTWIPMGPTSDYAGNFDTLYLRQLLLSGSDFTDTTPGNLDLGDLTVNGNIKSNLIPTAGHYLGTADQQWAALNASQVNSDNYYARYGYETATFHGTTTRVVLPSTAPGSPVTGEMWLA